MGVVEGGDETKKRKLHVVVDASAPKLAPTITPTIIPSAATMQQMNQMSQAEQMSQMGQMGQMGQMSQMEQMQMAQMAQMSQMGQMGQMTDASATPAVDGGLSTPSMGSFFQLLGQMQGGESGFVG